MSSTPKGIWLLLAASLALNMFCLGVFASRRLGPHPGFDRDVGPRAFMHHSGLRNAGPEVQGILKHHREGVRERMHALTDSRKRARDALRAEPFDRAQVEAAFADVRDKSSAMQADMHGVLLEVAGHLGPEQRKRMAGALWQSRGDVQAP